MKHLLILLIISIITLSATSQQQKDSGSISGYIQLKSAEPAAYASVDLLRQSDSAVIKSAVANSLGKYILNNIPSGVYQLRASATGSSKGFSNGFSYTAGASLSIDPVIIRAAASSLNTVTVVARKNMIEQKIDKTVINVDAFITNTGVSALDVLAKSPGVQVDKDGNISLKGKQGVMILIDGRPAYLSGQELANMLKGMESSQLDQVEIMTNPPAKYEAAGNAGIINIKTKKNKIKGFNGSIGAGVSQSKYLRTNESFSLNYRNNKFNLFSVYSFSRNNRFNSLDLYRRYSDEQGDTRAVFEQTAAMHNISTNHNLKAGLDYYLDKKNTLGVVATGFFNPSHIANDNTSYLKNPSLTIDSIAQTKNFNKLLSKNAGINLNLRHAYDTTGKELTADIDVITYNNTNDQQLNNYSYSPDWIKKQEENLRGDLPSVINIYSAKMDFQKPLKKEEKLELGWKSSYVTADSRANYSYLTNEEWATDNDKTNSFRYRENINALYVNLSKKLSKKLSVQTGLRAENTNYSGLQYGNPVRADSSFRHSYTGLFPTLYFSYAADKLNQFGFSAGRRIDRPQYENLNPFLFFIDKYTYHQGNPFLKPQYSNNFEVSHIFKGVLTTTLNYSVTKDLFSGVFDQDGKYATIVREGNVGRRKSGGAAVSFQWKVGTWLSSNVYANYNYSEFSGMLNGEYLKVAGGNFTGNMNNQFSFKKGWSAELSGWYRSKGIEGQVIMKPFGELSAGLAKQILKSKGSLKLGLSDMFLTIKPRGEINFKSTEVKFGNRLDTRMVNLTFNYRFGKQLNNNRERRAGRLDEQNRVKQ